MLASFLIFWVTLVAGVMGTGTQTYLALPGQALLALTAILSLIRRRRSGVDWKLVLPCLAALIYLGLRAQLSDISYLARPDIFLVLGATIAFCLSFLEGERRSFRTAFLGALVVLAMINVAIGFYHLRDPTYFLLPGYTRQFPGDRIGGLYTNPNHLCSFAALTLPLIIGAALSSRGRLIRLGLLALVSLGFGLVALITLSRAGLIGLGASLALLVLFLARAKVRVIRFRVPWWVFAAMALVASVALVVVIQVANKRGDVLLDTLSQRQQMASTAFSQWKENPVFGTGAGSYRYLSNIYRSSRWKAHVQERSPEFAHNDWVQLGAEYGLIGVALVLLAVFLYYWRVWDWLGRQDGLDASRSEVIFVAAASAGIAGVLIHSFFDFNLHLWSHVFGLSVLVGLSLQLTHARGGRERPKRSDFAGALALSAFMALVSLFLCSHWNVWRAEDYGVKGIRAAAAGEFTVSNQLLTQSLEIDPDNGLFLTRRATNHLGLAYRYRGFPQVKQSYEAKALADFERVTEINPRGFQGWFSQGLVLTELQRFDAAAHKFEEALKLAPYHRVVHFGYVRFLLAKSISTKDTTFAEEALTYLMEILPRLGSTPDSEALVRSIRQFLEDSKK